jgi:hypothetical protein
VINSLGIFKLKLGLRQYRYEITAFVVNLVATSITLLLTNQYSALLVAVIIFTISTFVVIYFKTKDRDFYFLQLNKPGDEKDWVGRGVFKFVRNEKCFEITNSHVGYIFPKTSNWDDYSYEMEFKIVNKYVAWIVRANNLSNYIMLQCQKEGVNPHIRLNGQWIVKKFDDPDVNLTFDNNLSPDTWYKAKVVCEKRNIRIVISNYKKVIFDRYWIIPNEMLITLIEVQKDGVNEKETKREFIQSIDFDFGAIGLRDHGNERGFIKNVFIEKL